MLAFPHPTPSPPDSVTLTASLLLGALVGAANAAAAVWTVNRAAGLGSDRALRLVLGGMALRLLVVLAVFAAVIAALPVHRGGFVTGLGVLFAAGLAAEIVLVLRRSQAPTSQTPADA